MTQHELAKNTLEMQLGSAKLRVAELESAVTAAETDNAQLRKDKLLLVDHVADLQSKVSQRSGRERTRRSCQYWSLSRHTSNTFVMQSLYVLTEYKAKSYFTSSKLFWLMSTFY